LAVPVPEAPPVPSWPTVIATTFRLWFRRRVLRVPDQPGAAQLAWRRALAGGLVVVLLAAAASVAAVASMVSQRPADPSPHHAASPRQRDPAGTGATTAAAVNRAAAAAWIATQVSRGVIVACDPLMCAALQQRGFPVGDLDSLGNGAGDPLGSGIVVSTAAVRAELGTRLAAVYAPAVIASFGTGSAGVQVRVTAADGSAAYLSSDHADLLARQSAGELLARNQNIHLLPTSQQQLMAGHVDSRLLITLAALAHSVPVYVLQFGDSGPGAAPGTPLRSVTIAAVQLGGHHTTSYLNQVLEFLRAQRAPLRASTTILGAGSAAALRIEFAAPSPPGLLTGQAN
jgi:hypothetical protein